MGPDVLMAVRHGESAANAAYRESLRTGQALEFPRPDADVPLTDLGRTQAAALGRWLDELPATRRPELVWCSTYHRARETWRIAASLMTEPPRDVHEDERLIDRVMGELELMNHKAVDERFPEEARKRALLGEWAYRPPGGESFADVAARLRAFLADLNRAAERRRVLVVAHDSVVAVLRHVLERDDDTDMTGLATFGPVANASVSTWERRDGRLHLGGFNAVGHL
ncbi:histidine phosphatase family protein [Thermopolyspora sp. NPDC052614]|uniref:histidine phosphatase family protein n=1 Tax=Thermopolyspora sp. NPDC052614 TaxID=3155682 RepID=UPI00342933DF